MKIDSALMFDPVGIGAMAARLEEAGFDGACTFEGQSGPFIAAAGMHTQEMELVTSIAVAFASPSRFSPVLRPESHCALQAAGMPSIR